MNLKSRGLSPQRDQFLGASYVKALAWVTVAAAGFAIMGCTGKYSVGGTVTGLRGQGLVLEDNSGNDLSVSSNGSFIFSKRLKNAITYSVTVKTQPSNPAQTCTVQNGSGTIDKANVTNVVVSCAHTGRFAYVANQLSNDVSAYTIDNTTGALTATGISAPTGSGPDGLAVDPTDRFLYVANLASNSVSAYAIDTSTGLLTQLSNSPFGIGATPSSLQIDPSGSFLYVTNAAAATISEYSINASTGGLTAVSGSPLATGSGPESLAIDPAGLFVYAANVTAKNQVAAYSITPGSGALTLSGSPVAA